METWYIMHSGAGTAAWNMALDETLMREAPRLGQPILRQYRWSEPAASFGLFQKYEEVASWTRLRPLVRRPTGGGLVPHLADWTYSLVFPPSHPWYALRAAASYQRLHEWFRQAFALAGLETELCPVRRPEAPGQCFAAGAEQHDLLWQGRKLAGAAQRRTRTGFLIQGSVQPTPSTVTRLQWEQALRTAAKSVSWVSWQPDERLKALAEELAQNQFSQAEYNQRR